MAYEFSCQECYKLQPQKSVVIEMKDRKTKHTSPSFELQLNDSILPNSDKAVHVGIQRSKTGKETIENNVYNNITKARRTAYSLMSEGFHGNNGLDPITYIHILKTYNILTLTYRLEIIVPDKTNLEEIVKFHKRIIKQILYLPQSTPDVVQYVISRLIPIDRSILEYWHLYTIYFY
ncbi:unnamed protein product [Mytilus coruscus]|uniref:Uncharacterized protein n=1 Tax=Mytilus coruscus TaxID=42192 RepID=A0A6J8CM44_MYTCO|nr:unnamed protein product [Mytilus coruscus]